MFLNKYCNSFAMKLSENNHQKNQQNKINFNFKKLFQVFFYVKKSTEKELNI